MLTVGVLSLDSHLTGIIPSPQAVPWLSN